MTNDIGAIQQVESQVAESPAQVQTQEPVIENNTSKDATTVETEVQKKERMIPEHVMASIVSKQVQKAKEEAKNEALEEFSRRLSPKVEQQSVQEQPTYYTRDQLIQRDQHIEMQRNLNNAAEMFVSKIQNDLDSNPEIKTAMTTLGFNALLNNNDPEYGQRALLMASLNNIDNVSDVLLSLKDDISKQAALENVLIMSARRGIPAQGIEAVKKYAESVKRNKESLQKEKPQQPYQQLKPSSIGTKTGEMSISEARLQSRKDAYNKKFK